MHSRVKTLTRILTISLTVFLIFATGPIAKAAEWPSMAEATEIAEAGFTYGVPRIISVHVKKDSLYVQ